MPGKFCLGLFPSQFCWGRYLWWGAGHVRRALGVCSPKYSSKSGETGRAGILPPGYCSSAGRSSQMFEQKVPVGFPDINTGSTPTSAFKLLTTDPLPQPDTHARTHTSCLASLRASSLNFDLITPATNLALYQLKWNLHILSVRMFYFCALTFASVMTEVLRIVRTT